MIRNPIFRDLELGQSSASLPHYSRCSSPDRRMASNQEAASRAQPYQAVTVKQDGLAQVHPSNRKTALYPTNDEEGLALRAARKRCLSELVRVGSNPTYTISLRSMADTLDSMLLDQGFCLSEAGRYFKEHAGALRSYGCSCCGDRWRWKKVTRRSPRFGMRSCGPP